MIAQEKEEHKIAVMSSPPKVTFAKVIEEEIDDNENDGSPEDCPLLGQPAGSQGGRDGGTNDRKNDGYTVDDLDLVDAREELEYHHRELLLAKRAIQQLQNEKESKDREAIEYAYKVERQRLKDEQQELDSARPRLITWGQQSTHVTPLPQKSVIDYLSITCENNYIILEDLIELLFPNARIVDNKAGLYGYKKSKTVLLNGQFMGMIAYEGNKGKNGIERPLLSISGDGCRTVKNWNELIFYIKQLVNPKITRIDLALDFFDDLRYTIEVVQQAHTAGKFMNAKSRKNPLITPYGGIQPDGTNPGRTLYIGSKDSNKRMRIYEKDLELWGKLNPIIQLDCKPEDIEIEPEYNAPMGATLGTKWLRAELQYRSKNLDLSLDMIENRDIYFAGAYPYCEELIEMNNGVRPKALKTKSQTTIELKEQSCRKMFGNFLYTRCYGMSDEELVQFMRERIFSYKIDNTLVEAGLFNEDNVIRERLENLKQAC